MTKDEIAAARSLSERLAKRIGMEPHFMAAADTIELLCDEVERAQMAETAAYAFLIGIMNCSTAKTNQSVHYSELCAEAYKVIESLPKIVDAP